MLGTTEAAFENAVFPSREEGEQTLKPTTRASHLQQLHHLKHSSEVIEVKLIIPALMCCC